MLRRHYFTLKVSSAARLALLHRTPWMTCMVLTHFAIVVHTVNSIMCASQRSQPPHCRSTAAAIKPVVRAQITCVSRLGHCDVTRQASS
jgi:hypothetical protein